MIYAVLYFYPDGSFAGVIGFYSSPEKANDALLGALMQYSDCTFITTTGEVE